MIYACYFNSTLDKHLDFNSKRRDKSLIILQFKVVILTRTQILYWTSSGDPIVSKLLFEVKQQRRQLNLQIFMKCINLQKCIYFVSMLNNLFRNHKKIKTQNYCCIQGQAFTETILLARPVLSKKKKRKECEYVCFSQVMKALLCPCQPLLVDSITTPFGTHKHCCPLIGIRKQLFILFYFILGH